MTYDKGAIEAQAAQTPLTDLLRAIPKDHRVIIESPFSSHSIPVGRLMHEAADALAAAVAKDTRWQQEMDAACKNVLNLTRQLAECKAIGERMSNICFNLSQHEDTKLDADARRSMRQCQLQWDAATRAKDQGAQG